MMLDLQMGRRWLLDGRSEKRGPLTLSNVVHVKDVSNADDSESCQSFGGGRQKESKRGALPEGQKRAGRPRAEKRHAVYCT